MITVPSGATSDRRAIQLARVAFAATVSIAPAEGQVPLSGSVGLTWERASGAVRLDGTSLATREARANLQGTLGENLQVHLSTSSIRDIEPVVRVIDDWVTARPLGLVVEAMEPHGLGALQGTVGGAHLERGGGWLDGGHIRQDQFLGRVKCFQSQVYGGYLGPGRTLSHMGDDGRC